VLLRAKHWRNARIDKRESESEIGSERGSERGRGDRKRHTKKKIRKRNKESARKRDRGSKEERGGKEGEDKCFQSPPPRSKSKLDTMKSWTRDEVKERLKQQELDWFADYKASPIRDGLHLARCTKEDVMSALDEGFNISNFAALGIWRSIEDIQMESK